ncbi:hypothetical protein ACQPW3_10685 [Actinosynnema sp. CA-248983]
MSSPTSTTEALRRLNERISIFCEHIAQAHTGSADQQIDADELPDVITQEVTMLVMDGPVAYLAYLRPLDESAARHARALGPGYTS